MRLNKDYKKPKIFTKCQWCNKKVETVYFTVIKKVGLVTSDFGLLVCEDCFKSRTKK